MKIFIVICLLIHSVGSADPFYLIAHMVNNRASLDWALGQGANAIENDFQFNSSGYPRLIEHGNPCDCICAILPGHVCHHGLNMKCSGSGASRNIVEDVANRSGIALYYIDSKLDREIGVSSSECHRFFGCSFICSRLSRQRFDFDNGN